MEAAPKGAPAEADAPPLPAPWHYKGSKSLPANQANPARGADNPSKRSKSGLAAIYC